jgi:outer membrane immunogenic protein
MIKFRIANFDFSGTSMQGSGSSTASTIATAFYTESYNVRSKWTATSTATVGIASGTWLFYGKAGVAFVDNSYGLNVAGAFSAFAPGTTPFSFASSTDRVSVGWTSGIGVKWALSNDLFVNAEYDFMDFGSTTQTFNGTFTATPASGLNPAGTFTPVFYQTISEVKVGINYKFSSGLPL